MSLINELLKEKELLQKRIDAINVLLDSYDFKSDVKTDIYIGKTQELFVKDNDTISEDNIDRISNFPKYGRTDQQIVWVFENAVERGIKLSDLQNLYNKFKGFDKLGNETRIDNVARRMKKKGILASVKYNKSNKLTYWGLSHWIKEDGFLERYKPTRDNLPINIEDIQVSKK
ncbi:hypothetical protein [uncultured Psychroserpens sp.]|uniref:hypothetical protein n=1 Tax=uncultured Psychroserpens sp. TaxID=255436 RepID=UPI0026124178|nr:hypothetical protein [uncultured Psychroserpens sp.]